jgi:hypothetical protein
VDAVHSSPNAGADVGIFHPALSRLSRGQLDHCGAPPSSGGRVEGSSKIVSAMKHFFSRYIDLHRVFAADYVPPACECIDTFNSMSRRLAPPSAQLKADIQLLELRLKLQS